VELLIAVVGFLFLIGLLALSTTIVVFSALAVYLVTLFIKVAVIPFLCRRTDLD
jgi:hypothetical protein